MTELDVRLKSTPAGATLLQPADDAETLSLLVGAVYDAAVEPGRWSEVLGAARDYVGGEAAVVFSKEISGAGGLVYHQDGRLDPHYAHIYYERYSRMDPTNVGHLLADIDQPVSVANVVDYDDFRGSRFHTEWTLPQGYGDFVGAPIEKTGSRAAMFGVFRHVRDGMADEDMLQRMRLLVPHIRRAMLIGRAIEKGSAQAASFCTALEGLAAGLFFVDRLGRVVHTNAAGGAILAEGIAVTARDGRLVAADRAAGQAFAEAISAAAGGDQAVGTRGISVPIEARDGSHFAAHILPLTSGARCSTGASFAAVAAVFVHPACLHAPAAPELVARTFGLTVSELRVLVTIVQAGGVAEVAETLEVGEATIKTHLHRIFAKTGTSRQADLVKLLAGFAGPLSA